MLIHVDPEADWGTGAIKFECCLLLSGIRVDGAGGCESDDYKYRQILGLLIVSLS